MGIIRDQLATLRIRTQSVDGTAQCHLFPRSGLAIELVKNIGEIHTAESLEEQIESAVDEALSEYSNAVNAIQNRAFGPPKEVDRKHPSYKEFEAYNNACKNLKVKASSPRKFVSVEWIGKKDVIIVLHEGAMTKIGTPELETEINSALHAASVERRRHLDRINETILSAQIK